MEMNGFISRIRLVVLFVSITAFLILILFNYGRYMLVRRSEPVQPGIMTERSSILDRNGKILAVQTTLYNIAITRSAIDDKAVFANRVGTALSIPEGELLARLSEEGPDFMYLRKKISESEKSAVADTIARNKLRGIRLEPVMSRTYPENSLASHIVGFLGDDGRGLTGVEYSFQDILSPPVGEDGVARDGYNVMLTIDGSLQYELEKIAADTMSKTKAEAVMMIAASAKTGEILAYISQPSANLNAFTKSTESERKDRPALYAYEPGSVFKIFSVAALMDLGAASNGDLYLCDGRYSMTTSSGERINIKCLDHHGWITPRDVIRFSCNDGTAQMAEKAESAVFEKKLRAFGFGAKTGIELPGETAGIFSPSPHWSFRSKPTIAIGQEISVSALQMVEAATVLANKGERVKLSILSRLYTRDGLPVYEHERTSLGRVISADTARYLLDYMQTTSESGTGTKASVGDVPMAVKTGTAEMSDPGKGGYSDVNFISSCIGIFPANDPQVILYLAIVKPVGETYGGRIAAPVISVAANVIIDYLGIGRAQAPSVRHTGIIPLPANSPVRIGAVMPDLTGISKRMLTGLLERGDIVVIITGDGYVVSQSPPPGASVEKGMTIELRLE